MSLSTAIALSVTIICFHQCSLGESSTVLVSPEHESLERYLAVKCFRERITVQLDFNRGKHSRMSKVISEMIWRGRICIGDDKSGECCSQLNMIQEYHVISVGYRKCDIEKTFFAGGFNFVSRVHYWGVANVNQQFRVECAVPFMESHVKAKMVASRRPIKLATIDFVNDQQSSTTQPLALSFGASLHLAIESTIEGMQQRLHTYPLTCWISAANGGQPIDQKKRESNDDNQHYAHRYFIRNGCPIIENNSQLAFLEQKTGSDNFAEWTKIAIPITQTLVNSSLLLNGSVADDDTTYGHISVHCDVIICTGQRLAGFQNTPMCPRASFCLPAAGELGGLPAWIEPLVQRSLSVGLGDAVRIVRADQPPAGGSTLVAVSDQVVTQADSASTKLAFDGKCASYCATAIEKALRHQEECLADGIPVYVAVIIAIISFGFGIAFVATLWIIHIKTDPLRKIRCMERNGYGGLPLDAIHRDPIIRPVNANAFMTPNGHPVAEQRQRLMMVERNCDRNS